MKGVYLACYRRLVAQLYVVTGDLAEAQDTVQEAFVRALARPNAFARLENPEWTRGRHPTRALPDRGWVALFGLSEGTPYVVSHLGTITPWQLPDWLVADVPSRGQDGSLWLVGAEHGTLGRSTDQGRTWTRLEFPRYVNHDEVYSVVHAKDERLAVAVEYLIGDTTRPSAVHVTTDGGQSWSSTLPDPGEESIDAPIPWRGYAAFGTDDQLVIARAATPAA